MASAGSSAPRLRAVWLTATLGCAAANLLLDAPARAAEIDGRAGCRCINGTVVRGRRASIMCQLWSVWWPGLALLAP